MDHLAARRLAALQRHLECLQVAAAPWGQPQQRVERLALSAAAAAAAATAGAGGGTPVAPATTQVVVLGGMVMDLQARPDGPADVARGGSVPGVVTQSPGGVGRNIAQALALLQREGGAQRSRDGVSCKGHSSSSSSPLLVSVVGGDAAGTALLAHWRGLGLSVEGITVLQGERTPTVSVVFGLDGEVAACVADVSLLERALTPALLREARLAAALAAAPLLLLDGNLAPAAIEEAAVQAAAAGVPAWFEPVSPPKATRALGALSLLAYASPNAAELATMAAAVRAEAMWRAAGAGTHTGRGSSSSGMSSLECCRSRLHDGGTTVSGAAPTRGALAVARHAADLGVLLRAGLQHVVLTLGAEGAALCTLARQGGATTLQVHHLPALPASVANCSGAGDCLVAGCLFALAAGEPPLRSLAHGVAAATAAVQCTANVPPTLSAAAMHAGAAAVLEGRSSACFCCCPGCCGLLR